jgi:succinate dehydrogenase/fumarate reductase-like Fe-S protein
LNKFFELIHNIGDELENMGVDINANERLKPLQDFQPKLEELKSAIDKLDNNLVLKKIFVNLRNIINRIHTIYSYFKQKKVDAPAKSSEDDLGKFVLQKTLPSNLQVSGIRCG